MKCVSCFMLKHFMTSWHLNIWKVKIWLSQKRKELSKWNKKHFSLFQKCSLLDKKQTGKNVADLTFKWGYLFGEFQLLSCIPINIEIPFLHITYYYFSSWLSEGKFPGNLFHKILPFETINSSIYIYIYIYIYIILYYII